MAYTDIDKPSDHFDTKLYTGTSGAINITGLDFQPDWVWCKNRASGNRHALFDSVRGVTKRIRTDGTDVEVADPDTLTSFNSDGFTVGADAEAYGVNANNDAFVSWNWKAGTSFTNDASSTSVGSVDTAGSVNTTAGFSIMKYTGVSGQQTIAHGLGAVPRMIIVKNLDSTETWRVYHHFNTAAKYMKLNTTAAVISDTGSFSNVTPTSSVITMGGDDGTMHANEEMIAYIFAEKQGYSKFGSYTGNGNANGIFVYTGFKPAWIMFKNTVNGGHWQIYDTTRNTFNVVDDHLKANANSATIADDTDESIDIVSNGFKCRGTSNNNNNHSGNVYIFMAFAKEPFATSKGIPATAR